MNARFMLVGVACALAGTATVATASPPPDYGWEEDVINPFPVETVETVEPVVVVESQVAVEPEPVIQTDPVGYTFGDAIAQQPYSDPYYVEAYVPPPPEPPRESIIVTASAMQAWVSEPSGLEELGRGGTLGFTFLQRRGNFPTGGEITGTFLFGERASVYDLSMRMIGSPKMGSRLLVPYVAVGLVVGASRLSPAPPDEARAVTMGEPKPMSAATYGFGIGPSAAIGVHGFFGKKMYWRAGAGFLGAGVGAITADVGLGMIVD